MAFLDKIQKVTQDVVRGTKDFTDTARLNSQISEEQKQINNQLYQIGKLYYDTVEPDPDGPFAPMFASIRSSYERIGQYNDEIKSRKGIRSCPACGADVPNTTAFCGSCGAKFDAPAPPPAPPTGPVCKNCGAPLSEGMAFCTSCGQRQSD